MGLCSSHATLDPFSRRGLKATPSAVGRVCLDFVLAVTPFCWSLIKTRSSQDTLQLEVSGRSRPLGPGGDEPADVTVSEGGSALLDPRKA